MSVCKNQLEEAILKLLTGCSPFLAHSTLNSVFQISSWQPQNVCLPENELCFRAN